jgi:hypothetical protein
MLEDLQQSLLDVVPRHDLISLIDQDPGNTLIAPCEADTGTTAFQVGKICWDYVGDGYVCIHNYMHMLM